MRFKPLRLKEVINKILYKYQNSLDDYLLVIIDRMCESNTKYIKFSHVKHVDNNYLYISSGIEEETVIPIHRVIRIEKTNGEVIWSRIKQ
ncbi:MAG: RNA repair domain-containing protein [Ignisphaera sp.]